MGIAKGREACPYCFSSQLVLCILTVSLLQLTTVATELEEYVKYHLSVYLMLGISTYMFYSGTLHIMWERPSSIK